MSKNRIIALVVFVLVALAAYQVLSAPLAKQTGYQLVVDQKSWFTLEDKEEIEKMLVEYNKKYMPELPKGSELLEVGYLQKLEIEEVLVDPLEFASPQEAREKLNTKLEEATYIEVKAGDVFSTLANSNDLTVAEAKKLNPEVDPHRIFPGDKIKISPFKPKLDVAVYYKETKIETVPFPITRENDSTMLRSQQKILKKGIDGEKEVAYTIQAINGSVENRTVMNEKILKEPVEQVVRVGTKQTVSRGGSVSFGVVHGSRVTSGFGWRNHPITGRRDNHEGIDIVAPQGRVVYAYSQGTVSFASYNGGYGNVVYINHGNGMQTRYAHLSRIDVRAGQSVDAGQAIGRVGSTGSSTGPHLHFEVRINGSPKNPINYL